MDFLKLMYDICRHYLHDMKTVLGEELHDQLLGYVRQRNLAALASCTSLLDSALSGVHKYRCLMQVEAFFSKNAIFTSGDVDDVAYRTFCRAERLCRITNRRLDYYHTRRERLAPDLRGWLSKMEVEIDRVMGDTRSFLEQIPGLVRVTAGATASASRADSLPPLRLRRKVSCTGPAFKYLDALATYWGYPRLRISWRETNRIEFVPKSWKTSRTIACEPAGNAFLQIAVDTYIKRRLRRIGIDLSDQTRNQELARVGSISGEFATVDLSMASDTLAFNCVAMLFPRDWFSILRDFRSPFGRLERRSELVKYAKFSSMGNGSTFTIETLVFAAACRAVGSKVSCVYGDDIIIETHLWPDLRRLLKFLGFIVNPDKSHFAGPFRESCGANWLSGVDVTPMYIRSVDRRKAVLCHLVNGLAAVSYPEGRLWKLLRSLVESEKLPLAPYNESTMSGVWVDTPTAYAKKLITTNRRGFHQMPYFRGYIPKAGTRTFYDIRAYFLWHLKALGGSRLPLAIEERLLWFRLLHGDKPIRTPMSVPRSLSALGMFAAVISTRYSAPSHKFVRKWVYWRIPVVGTPDHLYMWSDFLVRRVSG